MLWRWWRKSQMTLFGNLFTSVQKCIVICSFMLIYLLAFGSSAESNEPIKSLKTFINFRMAYFKAICELARLKILPFDNETFNFEFLEYLSDENRFLFDTTKLNGLFCASVRAKLGHRYNEKTADDYFRWTIASFYDPKSHLRIASKCENTIGNFMAIAGLTGKDLFQIFISERAFDAMRQSFCVLNEQLPDVLRSYQLFVYACCATFHFNSASADTMDLGSSLNELGVLFTPNIPNRDLLLLSSYQGFNALMILNHQIFVAGPQLLYKKINLSALFRPFCENHDKILPRLNANGTSFHKSKAYVESKSIDDQLGWVYYFCQCLNLEALIHNPNSDQVFSSVFVRNSTVQSSMLLLEEIEPKGDPEISIASICKTISDAFTNAQVQLDVSHSPNTHYEKRDAYYMNQTIQYSAQLQIFRSANHQIRFIIDAFFDQRQRFYPTRLFLIQKLRSAYLGSEDNLPIDLFFTSDLWFYVFEYSRDFSKIYCACFEFLFGAVQNFYVSFNPFQSHSREFSSEFDVIYASLGSLHAWWKYFWHFFESNFGVVHQGNVTCFKQRYSQLSLSEILNIAKFPTRQAFDIAMEQFQSSDSNTKNIYSYLSYLSKIRYLFEETLGINCAENMIRPSFMTNKKILMESPPSTEDPESIRVMANGFRDALVKMSYAKSDVDLINNEFFALFIMPSINYLMENYILYNEKNLENSENFLYDSFFYWTTVLFKFISKNLEFYPLCVSNRLDTPTISVEYFFQVWHPTFWYRLIFVFDSLFYSKRDMSQNSLHPTEFSLCRTISSRNLFLLFENWDGIASDNQLLLHYCNPYSNLLSYGVWIANRIYTQNLSPTQFSPKMLFKYAIENLSNPDDPTTALLLDSTKQLYENLKSNTPDFESKSTYYTASFVVKMLYVIFCDPITLPSV